VHGDVMEGETVGRGEYQWKAHRVQD